MAALRIGVAVVLLVDILVQYAPHYSDYFGPESLSAVAADDGLLARAAADPLLPGIALALWGLTSLCLLLGLFTRWSAALTWALSTTFYTGTPWLHNAGDAIRNIILFYLMISPCGAVWSLDRRRRSRDRVGEAYIYPWPVRLLLLQLVAIYFFNGLAKVLGPQWRAGEAIHYVLANLGLTWFSFAELLPPYWLTRLMTWTVLVWELAFPLLIMLPATRTAALLMGVAFHLGLFFTLDLGLFAPYMLCMYLPLVPWERFHWSPGDRSG
jgi:hypothetical protein